MHTTTYLPLLFFRFLICPSSSASTPFRHTKRGGHHASSDHATLPPIFNTTVTSSNSTSPSTPVVQTKIYIPPPIVSLSNLTNRQILGERRIITCDSPTATFHHSHCQTSNDVTASMREYMAWCREPFPSDEPVPTFTLPSEARAMASSSVMEDPSLHGEQGFCDKEEVCIDSLYSLHWNQGFVLIANCVKKKYFRDIGLWNEEWDDDDYEEEKFFEAAEMGDYAEGEGSSSSGLEVSGDEEGAGDGKGQGQGQGTKPQSGSEDLHSLFAGKFASVVVTKDAEGTVPLRVEEMELSSLRNGTGSSTGGDGSSQGKASSAPEIIGQERKCTNCMHLKTFKPFTPDTEALEFDVKLIGAGSAALTGVLWVALLSG